jgi:hypothetical protein
MSYHVAMGHCSEARDVLLSGSFLRCVPSVGCGGNLDAELCGFATRLLTIGTFAELLTRRQTFGLHAGEGWSDAEPRAW